MRFKIIFCYIFLHCLNSSRCHVTQKISKKVTKEPDMTNSFGSKIVFIEIISHVLNSGELMLRNLDDKIRKQFKITTDTTILRNVTEELFSYIDGYSIYVSNQTVKCDLEREFLTIKYIETTNQLLVNQSHNLLEKILFELNKSNSKASLNDDIASLTNYIEKTAIDIKKDSFAYMCNRVNICRRFPSYSDYVAEILDEIIALPDKKLQEVVEFLNEILRMKATFFKTLMVDNIAKIVILLLSSFEKDIKTTRKYFLILKSVLKKKHNIFMNKCGAITKRKKAMRILIDIFDKSFERFTEDSIRIEVIEVVKSLRAWIKNGNIDMQKVLMDYVNDVGNVLAYTLLDKHARNEVISLIEILIDKSSNYELQEVLLSKGSDFVKYGKANNWIQLV